MAKVSSKDIEKINQTVSTASDISSSDINEATNEITEAISGLGKGLTLNSKKKTNKPSEKDIKAELNGLQVFSPEMGEIANLLIGANTNLETIKNNNNSEKEENNEDSNEKDIEINTDSLEPKDLANLTNLSAITGTGLAIVGNILNQLKDISSQILSSISQSLGTNVEETKQEEKTENSKGILAGFFQGISGPLESIAGSILMLSIAMTVLSTINLSSELIGTIVVLQVFMLTTFAMISDISNAYQSSGAKENMDPESKNENSIVNIVKNFAALMAITTGTFILIGVMITFLQNNWPQTILGLVVVFSVTLGILVSLTSISNIMKPMVDKEKSPLADFIKGFVVLIGAIVILSLICYALYPIISQGMLYAGMILGVTLVMILGLASILNTVQGVDGNQIKQFQSLINSITALVITISILTIILGIMPVSIVAQGMITVGLLMGITSLLIYMVSNSLQKILSIDDTQIQKFTNLIIATTVLIGILGIMVVVLGSIPTTSIIQGMITISSLMVIPFILLKTLPKLVQNEAQLLQAMQGFVVAGMLVTGISALAFLVIGLLGSFNTEQVLASMIAITIMTGLVLVVSFAIIGLAALSSGIAPSIGPALVSLTAASIFIVAMVGLMVLIQTILETVDADVILTQISSITLMSISILTIGGIIILLGGMAIPLAIASILALTSVKIITNFVSDMVIEINKLSVSITSLQNMDVTFISTGIQTISSIVSDLNNMAATMLQFAGIGITLTITLATSVATLLIINRLMPSFVISLLELRMQLNVFNSMSSEEMNFEVLNTSINQLNNFSQSVNNFTAPSLTKMIAVSAAAKFANSLSKQISKISSEDNIDKITNLSTSLSQLASNASSLQGLANSLRDVAAATKELNELKNSRGTTNIEDITGETFNVKQSINNLSNTNIKNENDNNKLNQTLNKLNESIQDMLETNKDIKRAVLSISEESKFSRESSDNKKVKVASEFDM